MKTRAKTYITVSTTSYAQCKLPGTCNPTRLRSCWECVHEVYISITRRERTSYKRKNATDVK